MKNNFTAVIPVRAGSRRLKNKNISSFNGSNLLVNKINQLKKVESISNIVVSSDSYEMLEMAKKENVLTFCDEFEKDVLFVRLLKIWKTILTLSYISRTLIKKRS